jgi:hypothetical protein
VLVYFSSETAQEWGPGRGDPGDHGGAFWLPGNALLELRMVPPVSRGAAGDAQVRLASAPLSLLHLMLHSYFMYRIALCRCNRCMLVLTRLMEAGFPCQILMNGT